MMKKRSIETDVVHYSELFGEKGALNVPIYQNSTFKQNEPGVWEQYTYTRTNNPTEEALRKTIGGLEGAESSVVFSSGLAAINAMIELLDPGSHVVSTADIYGGSHRLFSQFVTKRGITFEFVETSNLEKVGAAFKPSTKLVYVETPSNPLLTITDIEKLSELCKKHGALLAIDNTLATPFFQQPLSLGADIVIHSTSKYLSGHTNVVGGALVAKDPAILEKVRFIHKATGGSPGPFDCYLTMLGIKTLAIRMKQHEKNAVAAARFLSAHSKVKKVYYPGLESSPQYNLAKKQMRGCSGIVSFELVGDESHGRQFVKSLELFSLAVSFGSVVSLVDFPAKMSHKDMPADERKKRGFSDSLVRLSLGIEKEEDLLSDIEQALKSV